jgi:hypothetical protein
LATAFKSAWIADTCFLRMGSDWTDAKHVFHEWDMVFDASS